jgi:hypothetical protein
MKRRFSVAAGLLLVVTASAIGRLEISDQRVELSSPQAAEFGRLSPGSLTASQRQALQARFKYWGSSGIIAHKAPI